MTVLRALDTAPIQLWGLGVGVKAVKFEERLVVELAACKTLGMNKLRTACSRSSTVRFATGPKRSMGHLLGAKNCFAVRRRTRPEGGRAGLILSIHGPEVSLGSLRVGTIHVQAPTPHAPPFQSFLVDFSQQPTED